MSNNSSIASNVEELRPLHAKYDEVSVLRDVLVGPLQKKVLANDARLREVHEQLDEVDQRTADFSQILPASIRKLHAQDRNLNDELEPEITSGVYKCLDRQPERMAEVLYPILGPAVRKLVASLFQGDQRQNGLPFQIEQVFLIHKETSVVLAHSMLNPDAAHDADIVSGMLDAIKSFVQEAFELSEFDGMNSIRLGDLTIWVEWGPKAILAVVVRGMADQSVQDHYAEVLRLIHERYADELNSFNGDPEGFETLDLPGLQAEVGLITETAKPKKALISGTHIIIAVLLSMFAFANHVSDTRAWRYTLSTLAAEPGVVVINAERGWSHSTLTILRDPLAASTQHILEKSRVDPESVAVSWFAFQSQDPAIAHRRGEFVFPLAPLSVKGQSAVHSDLPKGVAFP